MNKGEDEYFYCLSLGMKNLQTNVLCLKKECMCLYKGKNIASSAGVVGMNTDNFFGK